MFLKETFYLKLKKPLNAHNTADVLKIVQDGGKPGIYGLLLIFFSPLQLFRPLGYYTIPSVST